MAESEFQNLTEAFNVLSDPERRRQYDEELRQVSAPSAPARQESARVWVKRGIESYRAGNLAGAEADLEQATAEDAAFGRAWYLLARVRSERKRRREAADAAVRACEVEPTRSEYLQLAGDTCAVAGRFKDAKAYYRKALAWGADEDEVNQALTSLENERRAAR